MSMNFCNTLIPRFTAGFRHLPRTNREIRTPPRFESKSFLENILESNAGGGGVPHRLFPAARNRQHRALLWALSGTRYTQPVSNRTDSVSRFESKSFRRHIMESKPGGGGGGAGSRRTSAANPAQLERRQGQRLGAPPAPPATPVRGRRAPHHH